MSIEDIRQKIKVIANIVLNRHIFAVLVIILTSSASFGLGRLSMTVGLKTPVSIEGEPFAMPSVGYQNTATASLVSDSKLYVASKNGTKYHFPWCSGAERIKEENKIWFSSKEEAEKAGYTPAANCKGL